MGPTTKAECKETKERETFLEHREDILCADIINVGSRRVKDKWFAGGCRIT